MPAKKHPAAVALGALGGKARAHNLSAEERSAQARKAGEARTANLTKAERVEMAKRAAKARWAKR